VSSSRSFQPTNFPDSLFFHISAAAGQGCQMVYFQTKNPSLGKFWRVLQWKMGTGIFYVRPVLSNFRSFGIFNGTLVCFVVFGIFTPFWYILPRKIWQTCGGSG
jgi:hypothetical protein